MKNCSQGRHCSQKNLVGSSIECNYTGDCDYQLPRDSRESKHKWTEEIIESVMKLWEQRKAEEGK